MAVYDSWTELKPLFNVDMSKGVDGLRGAPYEVLQFWVDAVNERILEVNKYISWSTLEPIPDISRLDSPATVVAELYDATLGSAAFARFFVAKALIGETDGVPNLDGYEGQWQQWNQANAETVLGPMPDIGGFGVLGINYPIADWLAWFYEYLNGAVWGSCQSSFVSSPDDVPADGFPYRVETETRSNGLSNPDYASGAADFLANPWESFNVSGFGGATTVAKDGASVQWALRRNACAIVQELPEGIESGLHVFGLSETSLGVSSYDRVVWIPEGAPYNEPGRWNHIESFGAGAGVRREIRQRGRVGYENALPPGGDISLGDPEAVFQGYYIAYDPLGVIWDLHPFAVLTYDNPGGFGFVD